MRDGHAPGASGVYDFGVDFFSFNSNLTINVDAFGLRSYFYSSNETLDDAPIDELVRMLLQRRVVK